MLDTASQRPATGMDEGARQLILDTLEGCPQRAVLEGFLRDAYAHLEDYVNAVREVWGEDAATDVGYAVNVRANEMSTVPSMGDAYRKEEEIANALLLHMPEPDFRLAVHKATQERDLAIEPGWTASTRSASAAASRGSSRPPTASRGSATPRWRSSRCGRR